MKSSSVNQFILETLGQSPTHLTAQLVYEAVRQRLPSVNPSTVYRALERLADAGMISVSDMGTGAAVFEKVGEHPHHHVVCQKCGAVATLDTKVIEDCFATVEQETGFQIATNHLVLFGCCPGCKKAKTVD